MHTRLNDIGLLSINLWIGQKVTKICRFLAEILDKVFIVQPLALLSASLRPSHGHHVGFM